MTKHPGMRNLLRYLQLSSLLCVVSLLITPAGRASISVSQSVDRTDMAFEDTANFRVVVTWDGPVYAYRFDKAFRLQSDRMKIARFSSSVRSTGTGPSEVTTKVFDYQLAPSLSGIATVQPMVIEYVTWPDSTVGQLATDVVTIAVADPVPAATRDKGGFDGGWIALIVVGVLGLVFGLYAAFKPKAKKEIIKSPAEAFLEQLESVRKESGMDLKRFQTGVSRCLTSYIQTRYSVDLTGHAASQAAIELERVEPNQTVREALGGWLARAEREKFSPIAAAPGEVTRLESEIRSFFERLK
jgi:hypothetical protein